MRLKLTGSFKCSFHQLSKQQNQSKHPLKSQDHVKLYQWKHWTSFKNENFSNIFSIYNEKQVSFLFLRRWLDLTLYYSNWNLNLSLLQIERKKKKSHLWSPPSPLSSPPPPMPHKHSLWMPWCLVTSHSVSLVSNHHGENTFSLSFQRCVPSWRVWKKIIPSVSTRLRGCSQQRTKEVDFACHSFPNTRYNPTIMITQILSQCSSPCMASRKMLWWWWWFNYK